MEWALIGVWRWPTRGFRTSVASSRLVMGYFGDDGACVLWIQLLYIVWYGLGCEHACTSWQYSCLWLKRWLPSLDPSLGRHVSARGSRHTGSSVAEEHWPLASRGGSWWDITPATLCQFILFSNLEDKARKSRDLTGACSPITLPVIVGLGGSMAAALNALAPVPTTGGREHFCARGLPIRLTLFPYWTVARHRALIDSLDPIFVFRAMVDTAPWWSRIYVGASSWSLKLFVDPYILSAGLGTPYWHPRHLAGHHLRALVSIE